MESKHFSNVRNPLILNNVSLLKKLPDFLLPYLGIGPLDWVSCFLSVIMKCYEKALLLPVWTPMDIYVRQRFAVTQDCQRMESESVTTLVMVKWWLTDVMQTLT